ncbi:MAG: aldose 1-epimerase family protein [Candidatus Eremiobacteraeota bacterium]|nr:aldose 1-epimerase family protein [Candidatus Eremiobacteraeota bacterium]
MPDLFGERISREQLNARVGSLAQVGGITEFTYNSGRGRGVRAVRVDTGVLSVDIVIDRALDIPHAAFRGTPFVWRTANDIAAPEFYEAAGDEWLRSFFGGWLTTCGLANFGPPGSDRWGTFGQHGRINNLPAANFSAQTRWEGDRCIFEVSGTMRETKALGEKLVLHRRWTAELGSSVMHLQDRVVNEGGTSRPHMILYHCNAGFPLLAAGTRVHVSHQSVQPRDEQAKAGMDVWNRGGEPQAGFAEQVFIHRPRACADGKARAAIVRDDLFDGADLGFEIAYDCASLPALFTWRKLDVGDYVMSVEPANTLAIQGRQYAKEHDMLPFLEPGEERAYELSFTALSGDALRASIDAIANANATTAALR